MLILFDIDGTLVTTERAGIHAMQAAGRALFNQEFTFEGVDFAGRLDPLIWNALAERNGIKPTPDLHHQFRAAYHRELLAALSSTHQSTLLPGVLTLIEALEQHPRTHLGIVTGNYRETGSLKIQSAGLEPHRLPHQAWGDEGNQRRDLPPLAVSRFTESTEQSIDPRNVVIIGDTQHDIDCAHANGHRVIAVKTGNPQQAEQLHLHNPDLLLSDLTETDTILNWLFDPTFASA